MKQFILKTSSYIFFVILTIILFAFLILKTIKKNAVFKMDNSYHSLIVGNSHSEMAFNDSLIANVKNISSGGESYFYTYSKLKNIISQNPNISRVFIEYNNVQINDVVNEWTWSSRILYSKLKIYLPFLEKEDLINIYNGNSKGLLGSVPISLRENTFNIIGCKYDYSNKVGGYLWSDKTKVDSLINSKNNGLYTQQISDKYSQINILYLHKIVDFCKLKKLKIYFVRSPQHQYNSFLKNEMSFFEIKEKQFKNIEFLDFNEFPIKNNQFRDFGHLNYKGARVFSNWFNDLITSEDMPEIRKQNYIDAKIKELKIIDF